MASSAPASLLDLPEEVYGLIYGRISSAHSKRAFRHAHSSIYRARSINDHLTSASVTGTANLAPCISALPCCATLRRLELRSCTELDLCLSLVTSATERGRAARRQMSNVHHLRLEDCTVSEKCGALLSCFFPKLRDGCEGASLELSKCDASPVALGSCIEMLKPQHLTILDHKTEMRLADEVFVMLGHATTLKHLEIRFKYPPMRCNVVPLKALSSLKVLKLWKMKPLHLGEVLAALPALEVLGIELDHEGSDHEESDHEQAGERVASSTVRQLHVPMVSLDSRPVSALDFPALDLVLLGGLDFALLSEIHEHEHPFEKFQHTVSWLSLLPLKAAHFQHTGPGVTEHVCTFYLGNVEALQNHGVDTCTQVLSPLKPALCGITALFVDCSSYVFFILDVLMDSLVELFPAIQELILDGEGASCLFVTGYLLECMRTMPRLIKLGAFLDGIDGIADDLLAPLVAARETHRQLQLDIWMYRDDRMLCKCVKATADQWEASMRLLAREPQVKMVVHLTD